LPPASRLIRTVGDNCLILLACGVGLFSTGNDIVGWYWVLTEDALQMGLIYPQVNLLFNPNFLYRD
jgi:hypothetical protein